MHERLFLWRICTLIGTSCVFQKIKKKKKKKKKESKIIISVKGLYDQIIFEWDFLNKTLQ